MKIAASTGSADQVRKRPGYELPFEGENDVYTQSWFPLCLSSELGPGQVIGRDFLDGRVAIFRDAQGKANVVSGYCPHLGADLSVGDVIDGNLQCAFHRWQYDSTGACVKTGIGDPPPKNACLFRFPTVERFGVIYAFNGEEPLWELMDFEYPDEELRFTSFVADEISCDGWVFACNTPDMQHIKAVHGIQFLDEDPHNDVEWEEYGFRYQLNGIHQGGVPISWKLAIRGSSTYKSEGATEGWWMGVHGAFSLPGPGRHRPFVTILVKRGDGSAESERRVEEQLNYGAHLLQRTAAEDLHILNTIHYRVGTLTKGDTTLAGYLKLLKTYPRANPAAEFIR